jgi:hypothetical protein
METRHHHLLLLFHAAMVLAAARTLTARPPEPVEPRRPVTPRAVPQCPPPAQPDNIRVVPSPWLNDPDRILNRFTFNGQEWVILLCKDPVSPTSPQDARGPVMRTPTAHPLTPEAAR